MLLPGVTADHLRADRRFRDLGLHDLQVIAHADADATCSAILDGLANFAAPPRTPLEELAEQIQALLGGVTRDHLEEALRLTGGDEQKLLRVGNAARGLALALLQVPLRDALDALEYLATRMASAAVDRILEIIAPTWVDLFAARTIAICATAERRPAAVLNAATRFAAEMYVRRATCRPPKTMWRVIGITAAHGELMFEDLATEIVAALLAVSRPACSTIPSAWQGTRSFSASCRSSTGAGVR